MDGPGVFDGPAKRYDPGVAMELRDFAEQVLFATRLGGTSSNRRRAC
jgi:hypothetical protein